MKEVNDNGNKGIFKRITAIVMSIFFSFSQNGADVTFGSTLSDINNHKYPKMTVEENVNFRQVANSYSDFNYVGDQIISLEDIFSTPVGGDICDTMVPQGLEIVDGLILISAYDGIDGYKNELALHSYNRENKDELERQRNHKTHNSVIIVLDQQTREILTTIELPDINHAGGIAVDNDRVYIAKSMDKELSVISLDKIKEAVKLSKTINSKSYKVEYDDHLDCGVEASFVTIRKRRNCNNQVVIGTWHPFPNNSNLRIYNLTDEGKLELSQNILVNSSANGATFIERDGQEYLILACSLGRVLNSNLIVYNVKENDQGIINLKKKTNLELPPMIEEIAEYEIEEGKRMLAIGTEGFTKRYKIGSGKYIPKGIMITDLDAVIDWVSKNKTSNVQYYEDAILPKKIKIRHDKEKEEEEDLDK